MRVAVAHLRPGMLVEVDSLPPVYDDPTGWISRSEFREEVAAFGHPVAEVEEEPIPLRDFRRSGRTLHSAIYLFNPEWDEESDDASEITLRARSEALVEVRA